jgi:hypothetical protein
MSDHDVGSLQLRFADILDTAFGTGRNPGDFVATADAFLQDIKRLPPHTLEEVGNLGAKYLRYFAVPRVEVRELPREPGSELTPNIRLQSALHKARPSL